MLLLVRLLELTSLLLQGSAASGLGRGATAEQRAQLDAGLADAYKACELKPKWPRAHYR